MQVRILNVSISGALSRIARMPGCVCLALLVVTAAAPADDTINATSAHAQVQVDTAADADSVQQPFTRVKELDALSRGLVEKAGNGTTPAHTFRIETRMYREMLRQTMLEDRQRSAADQLPHELLLDMVRMSALLHAAADCKTGQVIVCPPDLLVQLRTQQQRIADALGSTGSGRL